MFFKQVWRNSAKNRKGNGLFFGSLVIAIIAFYTLLSLGEQDVMRYLSKVESDAVGKLMMLLPVVYMVSLFFVFFLVYFACRYQADSRRREFGMYLMLGMKRSRMFFMQFCETLWNSMISLLIGIPVALFLTEAISLATAKIVGLGIIGHHFSFSVRGVLWTVCGFVIVQMLSMLIICIQLGRMEPADFLRSDAAKKQVPMSTAKSTAFFAAGIILLFAAYYLGMFRMRTLELAVAAAVFVCGIFGTFFFYRGLGGFLGRLIQKKNRNAVGLEIFTARQVQESVISQHKSLAVSSLLLLMAFACTSYGMSVGITRATSGRTADFSLFGEEADIDRVLENEDIREMVKDSYPMYLSIIKDEYWNDGEKPIDLSNLEKAIGTVEGSENMLENLHINYVIAESSYNRMQKAMGKDEIGLNDSEIAIYSAFGNEGDFGRILTEAIGQNVSVGINGTAYEVVPTPYYDNIVADRAITIYMAFIVPDELFGELAKESGPYCRNVHLTDEVTEEMGLMQAVQKLDGKLAVTGIEYDSFLAGIGRNLFYTVSASYLTVYLGILFLIISNTVIGLKFLIHQRQTKHRYVTLAMLGADTEAMCRSVGKQIQTFFLLVLGVSVVSSAAAICTMFTSFTRLPVGTSVETLTVYVTVALTVFVLAELIYIGIVKRTASREIRLLKTEDRG